MSYTQHLFHERYTLPNGAFYLMHRNLDLDLDTSNFVIKRNTKGTLYNFFPTATYIFSVLHNLSLKPDLVHIGLLFDRINFVSK